MDQGKLNIQHVKKVLSDSLGLEDIDVRLVNSVLNVAIEQVMFVGNLNNRRTVINPDHHIFFLGQLKWLLDKYMLVTACPNCKL